MTPRNAITGRPILSWKDGRAYLHLTRTLYLPCGAVENIRPCPVGNGTEIVTNRGLQKVVENYDDVRAAYDDYADSLALAGGAE
jgi:hypothetical protein